MSGDTDRVHETWLTSDRPVPTRFMRPLLRFTRVEAAGGVVLIISAVVALIWANGFGHSYEDFWDTNVGFEIASFEFAEPLKAIVNDALMAIFFFVVGLEIKRELAVGDLRDPKTAALPAFAALGGMVLPALLYVVLASGAGGEASRGWGIPMATDIAFTVGILSLLGKRVSVQAKLFLLSLAIADDIGAIAVIAIFYTADLSLGWLLGAIAMLAVIYGASRIGIRSLGFYVVAGVATWFLVFESGVHATLAGVALGFLTPVRAWYSDGDYYRRSKWILGRYEMDVAAPRRRERLDQSALDLAHVARESVSPLDRLERRLHPLSSFVIVPIFALANAGVRFVDIDVAAAVTSEVAVGVAVGLVIGKLVGISGATWLAVRFGVGKLPRNTNWPQIVGLAALAGVGFTVSLFITELAFTTAAFVDRAKIGIFLGSTVAGLLGYYLLRNTTCAEESPEDQFAPIDTPQASQHNRHPAVLAAPDEG